MVRELAVGPSPHSAKVQPLGASIFTMHEAPDDQLNVFGSVYVPGEQPTPRLVNVAPATFAVNAIDSSGGTPASISVYARLPTVIVPERAKGELLLSSVNV